MSMDTVTVKEVKAATLRLAEIINLHKPSDIVIFDRTSQVCNLCCDAWPCRTLKLTRRAYDGLTGATPCRTMTT